MITRVKVSTYTRAKTHLIPQKLTYRYLLGLPSKIAKFY